MAKVTYPKSYRLTEQALGRLNKYCELSGLDASEVARAAIAQFIAPTLQGVNIGFVEMDKGDIQSFKKDVNAKVQTWFKSFWEIVKHRQFEKRVIKTIKDHWSDLSSLDPLILGEKYNNYCEAEEFAGRTFCHPNSWLANGGYNNENKEQSTSEPAWDIE